MTPDNTNSAERLEEARSRASKMLALAHVLGAVIEPAEIQEAALVPLPPAGAFIGAVLINCAGRNFEGVARILAGLGDERALATFMGEVDSPKALPAPRRRSRPTAADRARRAAEFLAGPAWQIVDPDPNPFPTEGAP